MVEKGKKPNILFLMSDQHRYDCVGFSEACPVKTPNLDRLAAESVWFDQAYAAAPVCCPARQAFISGKRAERFGALWNYETRARLQTSDLPVTEFSFARALKEAGYQTGYAGKWHVSPIHDPVDFGFDEYCSVNSLHQVWRENNYKGHWQLARENGPLGMLGGMGEMPYEVDSPHYFAQKSIEMMEKMARQGEPFCMVLSIEEPHLPCYPQAPFADMFSPDDVMKWSAFDDTFEDKPYIQKQMVKNWGYESLGWDDWKKSVACYYGSIAQMDDAMGRVLDWLRESGLEEDTVVIYTTDHGDMCGNHRMYNKCYVMYDDVVHVPMMVKWKNRFAPRRCSDFVHNLLDIHATILALAGAKGDQVCDGESLLPQLDGTDQGRKYVLSTFNGCEEGLYVQRMIRGSDYKYIWNMTDVDELYDLKKDPNELCNEVHNPAYADVLRELRLRLYEELHRCDDRMGNGRAAKMQLLQGNKW